MGPAMGGTVGKPGWRAALSSLENPQYRWLYVSNIAFFFAMSAQGMVRAWLAFQLTGSELALGYVSFAVALPMLLVAPIGGVVADRVERRNLIALGQALIVATEISILALLVTDTLQFWHLLVATGMMGVVFPFTMPARQAIVVNIVGKRGLVNAMALSMAGMNATRILGPAVAGLLIATVGISSTYFVGVLFYASALLCMFRVKRSHPPEETNRPGIFASMLDGGRYVLENRLVMTLLIFGLLPMFLAMPFQTLLVVFADEIWDVGSQGLGALNAAGGVGGIIGSIYIASRGELNKRLRTMMVSMLGFGSFLLLFSISPYFLLALPLVLVANIFASIYSTLNNTSIQLLIPDNIRGRISSFLMMSFSLPLLGTLPMAALAEVYGAPVAVAFAAVLATVATCLLYAGSSALRGMDEAVRKASLEE
jgi:MFS family permease